MEMLSLAMFIQDEKISEIRGAADIVEVVSESVQLKKSGQNYMGLCPFHPEKTPSFSVNPQREIYHCFGCGAGGDVFSFVMKRDGFDFLEAVRNLAGRYGVDIPEKKLDARGRRIVSERESIYKTNKIAMDFFRQNLHSGLQAEKAMTYLRRRGITPDIMDTFSLGYVPDGWEKLTNHLAAQRIPSVIAEKSGLIVAKNQGRYYDRFRNRIVFPIIDINKQVIGFGGRVLDDSLPKYLNSPETLVYNKSKSLYGYNCTKPKCRETETVHIVEGYFDLIALYTYGVQNVVATLGTAMTPDHVRMLSRGGVKKFVLVYDSDNAGLKAAERSIPIFQKEFINANILVLPEGYDPDSFIREFGKEKFIEASDNAMGVMQFLTESAIKRHGLTIEGRIKIIDDLKNTFSMINDSLVRSLYIRDIAGRLGVDEIAVLERFKEGTEKFQNFKTKGTNQKVVPMNFAARQVAGRKSSRWSVMEHQIASMMLQFPVILDECLQRNVIEYFEDEDYKTIASMIFNYTGEKQSLITGLMTYASTDQLRELIASLSIGEVPWIYDKCVNLITQFVESKERHNDSLSDRIRMAEENGNHELLVQLINEKNMYSKQLKNKQAQYRKK